MGTPRSLVPLHSIFLPWPHCLANKQQDPTLLNVRAGGGRVDGSLQLQGQGQEKSLKSWKW